MKKLFRFTMFIVTWVIIITMLILFKQQGGFNFVTQYVDNIQKEMRQKEIASRTEQIKQKDKKEWIKNKLKDEGSQLVSNTNQLKMKSSKDGKKYKIQTSDIEMARKIMTVRYEIARNGYSTTRSVKIAKDICRESAVKIREQNSNLAGMNIITEPIVNYHSKELASHILGYVGSIDEEEYATRKDTYRNDDIIGKTGIQKIFEAYLKGKDGIRQIDMTVDGTITSEYISEEAVAGSDVILTIDANLQAVAEKALEDNIKKIANGGFGENTG